MSCTLSKFETYSLGRVGLDVSNNSLRAELTTPPKTCPDGFFASKKAELVVQAGSSPALTFNNKKNKAVITVPSKEYVLRFNEPESVGFGTIFTFFFVLGVIGFVIYKLLNWNKTEAALAAPYDGVEYRKKPTEADYDTLNQGILAAEATRIHALNELRRRARPTQTVIHQHSTTAPTTNNDLLTGVLIGNLLSGHHDTHTGHAADNGGSSSGSDSSSYSSNDNSGSSYSSDSSSSDSYSSDSSSSSDYSSSYDSGSSFSSDSGGGFDSGSSFSGD